MATDTTAPDRPAPADDPQVALPHERSAQGYRPALDGIRAIAVGSVVAYHFGLRFFKGGFLGVDVFFVLSGYLITSILLAEFGKRAHISLSGFYSRRLRRLFPALALVILAVSVDTVLFASPLALSDRLHDMLGALFYYANWHFIISDQSYFAGTSGASPLRHTWSLSIEEQFYFVWPLLLLLALRAGALRRRWALLAGLATATLLSAWAMSATYDAASPSRSYYGSDGRAQQLLVGALLAVGLYAVGRASRTAKLWSIGSVGGLLALLLVLHTFHDQASYYYRGGALLVAVITAALIATVERNPAGPVARLLSLSPMTWLGKVSYGIYLWHWPILLWVTLPAGASGTQKRVLTVVRIVLTLVVSASSYYLVERPIRSGQVKWIGRSGARTAVAFAATVSLLTGCAYLSTLPSTRGGVAVQATQGSVTACPHNPQPCLRVQGPAGAPVVTTVGDSTMQAYDPGLRQLAKAHGFTYVQGAAGGCPISHRFLATGLNGHLHKASNYFCYQQMPGIFTALTTTWHTSIFIGTSSNEESPSVTDSGTLLESGTPAHVAAEEAALEKSVEQLTSHGAWVVLVHILPRGPGVNCLDGGSLLSARCNVPVSDDRTTPLYNASMDRVAARHPSRVRVIDLSDLVCPNGICSLEVHGIVMRYDGGHYTRKASQWIAPYLYARIKAAGVPIP